MRTLLILLFLTSTAFAGIGVEHDGSGNIVRLDKDANPSAFTCENCEYYSVPGNTTAQEYAAIKALTVKYSKWSNGPVEMTQAEKDAVDAAELAAQSAAEDAAWNAMIDRAKAKVDAPTDETSLIQECISINIVMPEIVAIKQGNPKAIVNDPAIQKAAVKACLEAKKR